VFYKTLKGVITNNSIRVNPGDPVPAGLNPAVVGNFTSHNGVTAPVVLSYPANSPDTGKVKGFEVAYQQSFDFLPGWLGGFGVNANYTYVSSSGVRQTTLSATDPDVAAGRTTTVDTSKLPLQGLSKNSFNITPFYQKGMFEARLAYNWRSEFLLTPRDVIVPFQPILQEAYGSLDGSVFLSFTSHVKLGLQVANITNSVTKTRAVIAEDLTTAPRGFYADDRRYSMGLRWNFE
jgi:TonB-dependent receptor